MKRQMLTDIIINLVIAIIGAVIGGVVVIWITTLPQPMVNWVNLAVMVCIAVVIALGILLIKRNKRSRESFRSFWFLLPFFLAFVVGILIYHQKPSQPADLEITSPSDNAVVDLSCQVDFDIGKNLQKQKLNYYIIVKPKTGSEFVSKTECNGGFGGGTAQFGDPGVGEGEQYEIKVIGTTVSLSEGALGSNTLSGATFSHPVTVTRKTKTKN